MKYVVGIGEALWDHFVQEDIYKLGGAPANFAYHAGQFGLDSYVISAIGDDKLGHGIVENFDKVGLKHILPIVDYPTGEVLVTKENGQPSYEICLGAAWDNIPLTDQMLELARNAKAICFGSLAQRTQTSHDTIQAFLDAAPEDALRVFDINLRQTWYTNEVIIESLNRAHILKINDDELDVVANRLLNESVEKGNLIARDPEKTRRVCRALIAKYDLQMVILTCGEVCSYVFTASEESYLPTPKVELEDAVGAGDSFTATFVAQTLLGKSIREAHEKAVKVAAYVCTQAGAMPVLPDELKE